MRVKQKDIRNMIRNGSALDITNMDSNTLYALMDHAKTINRIYYSAGVYGCNGAVIEIDGTKYATCSRCSNMFIIL